MPKKQNKTITVRYGIQPATNVKKALPKIDPAWTAQVFTTPHNDRCIMSDYVLSHRPGDYYESLLKRFVNDEHFIVCKSIKDMFILYTDIEKIMIDELE
jgi:hypothetical protein